MVKMRLLAPATIAAIVLSASGASSATASVRWGASAAPPSLDGTCQQASPSAATCIGLDKLADAAATECRSAGLPDSECVLPLGHQVLAAERDAYLRSWVHRAVTFQYQLGGSLPLGQAQWLGTHNSFN